jgi:hypothetical protein
MNDELLKHALAVTGTVLYVARAAPATIQIARRREVDPEAATTFGLLLLTGLWWVAYSLEVHNLPSLLSAVLGLLAPAYGLLVLWRPRNRSRRRVRVGGRARRHVSGRADSSCDGGDRRGRRRRHRRPSGRAAAQRPRPLSSGRLDRDVGPGCLQCPGVAGLRRPRGTPSPRRGRTSPTAVLDDRHLLRATRSRRAAAARESRPRARGP